MKEKTPKKRFHLKVVILIILCFVKSAYRQKQMTTNVYPQMIIIWCLNSCDFAEFSDFAKLLPSRNDIFSFAIALLNDLIYSIYVYRV